MKTKTEHTPKDLIKWKEIENKYDLDYIVRAVNSHERLLAIAKYYHGGDDQSFKIHRRTNPNCEDCKTIAQAEGKS